MSDIKRYRVSFGACGDQATSGYDVCTWLGREKAIALATQKHLSRNKTNIYSVEVEELEGTDPVNTDLIDRMEW